MKNNNPVRKEDSSFDCDFLLDVMDGLSQKQKFLPCKYFYDERGSQLFGQICQLEEYYLTRTEMTLIMEVREEIAREVGPQVRIIEPGSGSGEKLSLLLERFDTPHSVTLVDISAEILNLSAETMRGRFPDLEVRGVIGDFTSLHELNVHQHDQSEGNRLMYFPGSTIGNFSPIEASGLLSSFAKGLGVGSGLLIGVDQVKSKSTLERAYNDSQNVTSAFNKNLLHRINRELEGDFDLSLFSHRAFYNEEHARIEMHLISKKEQTVTIAGRRFQFAQGESIHTENSYKYTFDSFSKLAKASGWHSRGYWTDKEEKFAMHYLEYMGG